MRHDAERLRAAARTVASVAAELADSADAAPERLRDLRLLSQRLAAAVAARPDNPEAWADDVPFVADPCGRRTSIPEMLLSDPGPDPRRTARLLLRAIDWKLPR